jgi:hypothetical protein
MQEDFKIGPDNRRTPETALRNVQKIIMRPITSPVKVNVIRIPLKGVFGFTTQFAIAR